MNTKKIILLIYIIIAAGCAGGYIFAISPILWFLWLVATAISSFIAGQANFD